MLNSNLAEIYGYELKAMNQQVKRNAERFPEDFMFYVSIVSPIEILFAEKDCGRRKLSYVFTE